MVDVNVVDDGGGIGGIVVFVVVAFSVYLGCSS